VRVVARAPGLTRRRIDPEREGVVIALAHRLGPRSA
jgi:hypothetical protein